MKENTFLVAGSGYPMEKSESLSLFLLQLIGRSRSKKYLLWPIPMPTKSLKLSFRSFCILAVGPCFEAQRDSRALGSKVKCVALSAVGHIGTLTVDLGHRHTACPTNS